jgi:mono/diheme cytochrome c family protein
VSERHRRTGGVSRRVERPQRDYPVARGVAPPPGWRQPPPLPAAGSPFVFAAEAVPPPPPQARRPSRGWLRQAAGVVLLAGVCMAAGWWLFQGRHATPVAPNPSSAEPEITQSEPKPAQPVAVTVRPDPIRPPVAVPMPKPDEPPRRAEPPSARPAAPASPPPMPTPRPTPPPAPPTTALTFEKDIRPIFQAKCVNCHGGNKRKGGLDLRTVAALLKGGDTGPSINRQNPEQSALWEAVANNQMPPGKTKLTDAEKKKLHDWLLGGAK